MNILTYKNCMGIVMYNKTDRNYFGRIYNIKDCVTFESKRYSDVSREFKNAVNDYLKFCEEMGKVPEFLDLQLYYQ